MTEPFAAIRKNSSYDGYIVDALGKPLCATNGHALVSTQSLSALSQSLRDVTCVGRVPDVSRVRSMLESVQKASRTLMRRDVHLAKPDETRIERKISAIALTRAAHEIEKDKAQTRIRVAEEALALAKGREPRRALRKERDDATRCLKDSESSLKLLARKLQTRDDPEFHALSIGEAVYDLRLIRRALKALEAREADLTATGVWDDPAILHTAKGTAIVMPFRQEPVK